MFFVIIPRNHFIRLSLILSFVSLEHVSSSNALIFTSKSLETINVCFEKPTEEANIFNQNIEFEISLKIINE